MGEFSFCCKDNASADGFGRLRGTVGDERLGTRLVDDVGEWGSEIALEVRFSVIGLVGLVGISTMGPSSMSNIASEGA